MQEVRDEVEIQDLERQELTQEIEAEAWTKIEPEILKAEERVEELQEKADERKQKVDLIYSQERQKLVEKDRDIKAQEEILRQKETSFQGRKERVQSLVNDFVDALNQKLKTNSQEVKDQLSLEMQTEAQDQARRFVDSSEEECRFHAETRAKQILDVALDRFARPYCAERGIGSVNFPDANVRAMFCDAEGLNIKTLQDACGCDIIVQEQSDLVGVAGFDPVRRELTRRTLERVFKEKRAINPDVITRIAENQKKELFRQIKNDGDAVAKELRLDGLHAEVRQMMEACATAIRSRKTSISIALKWVGCAAFWPQN